MRVINDNQASIAEILKEILYTEKEEKQSHPQEDRKEYIS